MKYRLEIWQYHHLTTSYENDDVEKVLKWYKENWQFNYDSSGCTFYLFENNKRLGFDKCDELGFYD